MSLPLRIFAFATVLLLAVAVAACSAGPTPTASPTPPRASGTATATPTPTARPATPTPTRGPTATPAPGEAEVLEAFYRDKTITFIVGFAPGGGYDLFARLIGKYMPQYIPGNPRIVVRNVPGGGGLTGLLALMRQDADGYSLGYAHPRWINRDLLYHDVEGFTIDEIIPIGSPSSSAGSTLYYVNRNYATSFEDLMEKGVTLSIGQTEVVGPGYPSNKLFEALGVPLQVVYGYGGGAEIAAALARDELQVGHRIDDFYNIFPEWTDPDNPWVPLFYIRDNPTEDPFVMEYLRLTGQENDIPPHLYEAANVPAQMREYMDLGVTMFESTGRLVVMKSGTPDHIARAIKAAFKAAIEDPEFVDAALVAGEAVGYGDPAVIEELIEQSKRLLQTQANLDAFLALGD